MGKHVWVVRLYFFFDLLFCSMLFRVRSAPELSIQVRVLSGPFWGLLTVACVNISRVSRLDAYPVSSDRLELAVWGRRLLGLRIPR